MQSERTKTSLKRPLESLTNARRWEIGAAERQGKGRGTASSGKDVDDSDDEDHDDGNEDGDAVEGDEEEDSGGGGKERMMWERDGVGCKSMPMSLAMVASL